MGLLSGIPDPVKSKTSCQIRTVREMLEPDDQKIFDGWIANTEVWSGAGVAETMTKQGFPLGRTAVLTHRRKACSCFRI